MALMPKQVIKINENHIIMFFLGSIFAQMQMPFSTFIGGIGFAGIELRNFTHTC
jgi:hypothetical protein